MTVPYSVMGLNRPFQGSETGIVSIVCLDPENWTSIPGYKFEESQSVTADATTVSEKSGGAAKLDDVYLKEGYELRYGRESGLWCTIHHLHPGTMRFLAEREGGGGERLGLLAHQPAGLTGRLDGGLLDRRHS